MSNQSPQLVAYVELKPEHRATGNTNHYIGGVEMPRPAALQIVTYDPASEYYLFYCDETGAEMTDTWHASVEAAMAQAEFEFGVKTEEWHH